MCVCANWLQNTHSLVKRFGIMYVFIPQPWWVRSDSGLHNFFKLERNKEIKKQRGNAQECVEMQSEIMEPLFGSAQLARRLIVSYFICMITSRSPLFVWASNTGKTDHWKERETHTDIYILLNPQTSLIEKSVAAIQSTRLIFIPHWLLNDQLCLIN